MANYRERLAKRIEAERNAKGMSREDLAYKSGVNLKTIKRLEHAEHDPRPSTVRRVAEGLSVPLAELTPEAEADQLQRLEEKVDALAEKVDEMIEALAAPLAEVGERHDELRSGSVSAEPSVTPRAGSRR